MKAVIIERIQAIEEREDIVAFYACESGSRAWGFPSVDSDYDIRFLYMHPVDWYLSIIEKRDVIERPLENQLDISGWDLKKALGLFHKSNPPLLEWLNSPIVYHKNLLLHHKCENWQKHIIRRLLVYIIICIWHREMCVSTSKGNVSG